MYAIIFTFLLFFLLLFVMDKNKTEIIEGVTNENESSTPDTSTTYQSYSGNNPMILAQKNAANIQYLEGRMSALQTLEKNFTALQTDVDSNKNAIKQMAQIATQHISQVTGIPNSGPPPAITGLSSISNDPANTISSSSTSTS